MPDPDPRNLRPLVFSLAYRMLGSVSDAEDIVQETMLRLYATGMETIRSPEAFATTVATRLCLDQLRSARVRRERYVGTWLPEPLVADAAPDTAERVETADTISQAFLVLLETLSPAERAAFLLREVFQYDYADIADTLDRTPAACRQLVARARSHVAAGAPRFDASRRKRDELAARFIAACQDGDLDSLTELLAADAVFVGDGGGNVPPGAAISKPVHGRVPVARLLASFTRRGVAFVLRPATVNGQPGLRILAPDGRLFAVFSLDVVDGAIQTIRSVVNPDKLRHLGPVADLDALYRAHRAHRASDRRGARD